MSSAAVLCVLGGLSACRKTPPPPLEAQVSGTLQVAGVSAPVRIVRDRWGVPHVFAESRDDVFFAQGFVQAEDRLFQIDLWRRSAEGKLAEVLGANFIERDAMTRRLQYHGDRDAEWASYGPDARPSAEAFVRGVNAWVALARERPPELFAVAGWTPAFWDASVLLNRTDAFDRDGTITDAERAGWPGAVVDSVRRAAVPAFFTGLARSPIRSVRLQADSPPPRKAEVIATNPAAADVATYPAPSPRYLIHLHTPNWNAIGAAVPWRPGIVAGHDGATAWDRPEPSFRATVQAMPLDGAAGRIVKDAIAVKGRAEPFAFDTQITSRGVVVATDREVGQQFVLNWEGFRAGAAPAFGLRPARPPQNQPARTTSPARFASFVHPLAITEAARKRFNVGPLERSSGAAPVFEMVADPNVWDATRAMNAPGQSEDPDSPHYADLAELWSSGHSVTLAFSESAVTANGVTTLTLVPDRRR